MKRLGIGFLGILLLGHWAHVTVAQEADTYRVATYNISFHQRTHDGLKNKLNGGQWEPAQRIAEVIQTVRPDILLLNEFDYDPSGQAVQLFCDQYLEVAQRDGRPIEYEYRFSAEVNTGIDSGFDLNEDRMKGTANDCFGYGEHPGQFGMLVLSRFPIDREGVRTFQKFLWKDMPGALLPIDPPSGQPYYRPAVEAVFRLSSKSHWDVPIEIDGRILHFLVSHPTPPVFDGPEDRNGRRNHDEIRLWVDYVSGKGDYLYDDQGGRGGLPEGADFVIAGDLNADPNDGGSYPNAAGQLLDCPKVQGDLAPQSEGGTYWARQQAGVNREHRGDPANDTGDFPDQNVGNLRVDYVMPSRTVRVVDSAVVWPLPDQPLAQAVGATDHRMVWIDIARESPDPESHD